MPLFAGPTLPADLKGMSRTVGTFVRLGWRQRAHELLDFFFAGQRPPGWNQWAEVLGRELRQPRFVGDMPHSWVASDFIRSALDLFAYERVADNALVLAAGLPLQWLEGEGVAVENLRTPYGRLSYTLHSHDRSRKKQAMAQTKSALVAREPMLLALP
jgi:hypothetical protein